MSVAATLDILGFVEGESFETFTRTAKGIRARIFSEVSKGEAFARAYPTDVYVTSGPVTAGATPPRGRCRVEDLAAVRVLLVDVDPAKNTEDEEGVSPPHRAAARALALRVRDEVLSGLGVRAVVLSSGRGTTLVVRHADLSPTDRKTKALRRSILAALARGFTDPLAAVDEAVAVVNVGLRIRGSVNSKTGESVAQVEAGEGTATVEQLEGWLASLEARWPSPRPARVVAPAPLPGEAREWRPAYVSKAIEDELAKFSSTSEGGRNAALNKCAFTIGQLEAGGAPINGAVQHLADLALDAGMTELEVRKTLESGLDAGRKNPRTPPADRPLVRLPGPEGNDVSEFADESIHLTDLGNARRLARRHGADLRFCEALGGWHVWDGRRWLRDETGEVQRRAHDVPRELYAEAAELEAAAVREADPTEAKRKRAIADEVRKHAARSESEPSLRRLVALAEALPGVAIRHADLDRDPWLFNVQNGTIDLRRGELRPHGREDLLTRLSPATFDPSAKAPRWRSFVEKVLGKSADLMAFVQKAAGYSLSGDTREQVLFFLHGSGSNGKSTLLEVLRSVLGDYSRAADFSTFMAKQNEGPRNDVAGLRGARFVSAIEAKEAGRLDEGLVKQLTGGDTISARFLHKEFFEFQPTFKLWFAANSKPTIRGVDHGIWRRLRLVPFTVKLEDSEKDLDLKRKLTEEERDGILAWAVEGCGMWLREGLGAPEAVTAATEGYREEQDALAPFLAECCLVGDDEARVSSSVLYRAYVAFATENGERPMSQKAFSLKLVARGLTKVRESAGVFWHGLGLLDCREDHAAGRCFGISSPEGLSRGEIPNSGPTEGSTLHETDLEPAASLGGWVTDPDAEDRDP